MSSFEPPGFEKDAFTCPHCGAYAHQTWYFARFTHPLGGEESDDRVRRAICSHCNGLTLWTNSYIVYPASSSVPLPNLDLPEDIRNDYLEARAILEQSPRGAAALLRLCIQKVCISLGQPGANLNSDIAALVKTGLPVRVQQALDIVRVIGNNAVHPGQIDLSDDRDTALRLFALINLIADVTLTQPKEVEELYQSLPTAARSAIEKRDH